VLRMQDKITVDKLCGLRAWFLAAQHPEQIGRVVEHRIGWNRILTGTNARMRSDDHRYLRSQPHGLAQRRLTRIVRTSAIKRGKSRCCRTPDIHGMRRLDGADDVEHRCG
jgi:hypothetical protein